MVRLAQWVRSLDLTTHTSLSPIRRGFAPSFVSYKKGCTRLAAASYNVYQLRAHGRWFSPGTPASSTTKTGRHDIAEILLKVVLKHQNSNKSKSNLYFIRLWNYKYSLIIRYTCEKKFPVWHFFIKIQNLNATIYKVVYSIPYWLHKSHDNHMTSAKSPELICWYQYREMLYYTSK